MQRRFAGLIAVTLITVPVAGAQAQTTFGLIAGLNRATFTGSGASDVSSRTAFMVGGVAEFSVTETFSIRPELYYSNKGSQVRTELGGIGQGSFKLSYIQLPILAQLQTAGGGPLRTHLFSGVSFGLPLSCRLAHLGCDEIPQFDRHAIDPSVLVGFELEFLGVGIGVRYEAGLTSVRAQAPGNEIHNGVLSFTASHLFRR